MGTYSLKNALVLFGVAILGGIVSLGGYTMLASDETPNQKASATKASATAAKNSQPEEGDTNSENTDAQFTNYDVKKVRMPSFSFKEVSKKVLPTVVHIKTSVEVEGGQGRFPFFDGFPEMRKGSGSGVIYNKKS
jgi:S1-C subfamily serine protease